MYGPTPTVAQTSGSYSAAISPQMAKPPPLSPAGEKIVPNDLAFSRQCLQMIPALLKNIRLERTLTTNTKQWGLVLRIDFSMTAAEMRTIAGQVNRLVFWHGAGGTPSILIVVGQPLPPLP